MSSDACCNEWPFFYDILQNISLFAPITDIFSILPVFYESIFKSLTIFGDF